MFPGLAILPCDEQVLRNKARETYGVVDVWSHVMMGYDDIEYDLEFTEESIHRTISMLLGKFTEKNVVPCCLFISERESVPNNNRSTLTIGILIQ